MKLLSIICSFKQAELSDIFTNGIGCIIENKEVFQKSIHTGKFEGPYFLNSNEDYLELIYKIDKGMLHLINFTQKKELESSKAFKIYLKQAVREDVTFSNNKVIYNMMYFLIAPNNKIQGPFFITATTNKPALVQYIKNQKLYVLSRKQKFNFITANCMAM